MDIQVSSQNIDDLVQGIESIIENRCSLLDTDRVLLEQAIFALKRLRRKRLSNDPASWLLAVKVVELLMKFFV